MKTILFYLGFNQMISSRLSRFDSVSIVSRQSIFAIIVACLTLFSGNVWATTITNAEYTFGSGSTPSGWSVGSSNSHVANYLKFSSGDYLEMTTASVFASGEVLSSTNMQVEVSCGTFGTWSGAKSVKCTVELLNSIGTVLSTANATFSGLNNSEGTYRTAINVAKPADPSAIAKLRITFTNFTTGTTLRVKYVRLNYSTATATPTTYNVYLMSGCTGGSYSSNKGTSGSGTGAYSSCSKYSGISAGTSVTITAAATSGYQFDGWTNGSSIILDDSSNEITPSSSTSTTATFDMPSSDVVIWTCNFSETCANSMNINKGTATNCSFTLGTSGSGIASCDGVSTTVTITPNTGYGNPSVTQSGASAAPSITGSGTSWTVAYGANTTGTSTINVSCSANTYTITLNKDLTPTTAGTASITATYNSNSNLTSAITKPTKTGWTFAGYFTEKNGNGTQIIGADGNVIASVSGYTDGSKNWKYAGNITLYAKWTCTVTWSVNGLTNVYSTQTLTYNETSTKVGSVPGPPDPASYCGNVFAGWSQKSAGSESKTTSYYDDLFTNVAGSPELKTVGNVTFYAVFADYTTD